MILTAAELGALESDRQQIGVFFRLATEPVVTLWHGVGKIEPGINDLDVVGATYKGFSELGNIPAFRQIINGGAERVDFTMSGVSTDALALAMGDADSVKHKSCDLGFGVLDKDWQLLGPVHWTRHFEADYLSVNEDGSDDGVVRTVVLSTGSLMTGRKRVGASYCDDADQQLRSIGDLFFARAANYTQEAQKRWPVP